MKSYHLYWSVLALVCALASAGCNDSGGIISYDGDRCEPECDADSVCCAGECVDIAVDAYHCGRCWNRCRNHEVCDGGVCKAPTEQTCDPECEPDRRCCGQSCVDVSTDPNNCGVCGVVCGAGLACVDGRCDTQSECRCPEGEVCDENGDCVVECGSTLCRPGESCCGEVCSTLDTVENCGACGKRCEGESPHCQYGKCVSECAPQTCESQNAQCGTVNDGCGTSLECGECDEGKVCASNRCVEACAPKTCEAEGKNCGFLDDGCGNTLACGACDESKQKCVDNVCVDLCVPTTCEAAGKNCGTIDDGCSSTIDCGTCKTGEICKNNTCVDDSVSCTPVTCEAKGKNCGIVDDGCGKDLDCGQCSGSDVCIGNVCTDPPCTPTTCATLGKNCGTIGDGCGGTLDCGSCSGGDECKNNVCTKPECKPTTCAAQKKNCGSIGDGCGKTLNCGQCASSQECRANVCVDKPSTIRDTYPKRKSIKSLQPDFQDREQIIGNEVHGVAVNFVWAEWQPTRSTTCHPGQYKFDGYCFDVHPAIVDAIREYTNRGVVVTAVVYGVPAWAQRGCTNVQSPIFCAPVDGMAADYGRFAGFVAKYFNGEEGNGRVADFVIHNEVNSYNWFNPGCTSLGNCNLDTWTRVYADNYNAAYDAVKKEQKNAKVLISFDHYFGKSVGHSHRVDTYLKTLVPKLGNRDWMLAFHSYPPNLLSPEFGADDYLNNGIISFGNIGVLAGWLRQNYPADPHAWEIQLTENGINGYGSSMHQRQQSQLCQAFRNVLGTPGITSFVYHRLVDHPDETKFQLACGLWNSDGTPKPAWTTFALANRTGVGAGWPSCGFELLPYVALKRGYGRSMHWVTSRQFPSGVKTEQTWHILRDPAPNTQLVFECRVGGANGSHTIISPSPDCENQFNMGPMGYVYKTQVAGTSPIYRCFVPSNGDHFISPDPNCEGAKRESLVGYGIKK